MSWWILELVFVVVMVGVLGVLGPLIKRFGKAYAADVFQANPRTGKSYLVLMDFAYYMIFGAYVLFVIRWEPDTGWASEVNADQMQASVVRPGCSVMIGMRPRIWSRRPSSVSTVPLGRSRTRAGPPRSSDRS